MATTRANRGSRPCTRLVAMPGSVSWTGNAGSNRFAFDGRIGGHNLAPGSYRLTMTPAANGRSGIPQSVSVQIRR